MPDTFGAKQVASRIGTDAKTLRKFLRSPSSPYEAVGQGKRYEFSTKDLAAIRKAFNAWQSKNKARMNGHTTEKVEPKKIKVTINDGPELVMEADDEPSEEELKEIAEELHEHFPNEDFDLEVD